jgi:hypothetical protein
VVLVKDFARIHWQNLVNFGVLPLTFSDESDYEQLEQGGVIQLSDLGNQIRQGKAVMVKLKGKSQAIKATHALSERQVDIMLKGGLINWVRDRNHDYFKKGEHLWLIDNIFGKACDGTGLLADDENWQYTCTVCGGDGILLPGESTEPAYDPR